MPPKKMDTDQYSAEEAQKRLTAALRGARLAGHKPMESLTLREGKEATQAEEKIFGYKRFKIIYKER